jgi:GntR family transcriptional repressor for pyruvate dehydrogenase complex
MFNSIKNTRVSDEVISQIHQLLLNGKLKKGDRLLPEREMAKELGVSRPALREALSALESTGVIERRKEGGRYVRRFSSHDLIFSIVSSKSDKQLFRDLLEMREVLESKAVELAIGRATEHDLQRIDEAVKMMENSISGSGIEADIRFHLFVAAASHNEIIFQLTRNIGNLLYSTREKTLELPGRKKESIIEHRQIYQAIKEKKGQQAVQAMKTHIRKVEGLIDKM